MEFFMQTLVKRKHLSQTAMLVLNQLLMVLSTAAAVDVVARVNPIAAIASLVLNFTNRGTGITPGCSSGSTMPDLHMVLMASRGGAVFLTVLTPVRRYPCF